MSLNQSHSGSVNEDKRAATGTSTGGPVRLELVEVLNILFEVFWSRAAVGFQPTVGLK